MVWPCVAQTLQGMHQLDSGCHMTHVQVMFHEHLTLHWAGVVGKVILKNQHELGTKLTEMLDFLDAFHPFPPPITISSRDCASHILLPELPRQEMLSELVLSQWGSVRLFDLCLRFGHIDTALALALHGAEGCKLEHHHLGTARDASYAPGIELQCGCRGWKTCSRCCFGFPVENGVLMKDWDAPLHKAAEAARKATKTPLVSGILQISSRDELLPFTMSDEAAARLLDIAVLCGNSKAAANLAKTCPVRPLRRWRGEELCRRGDLPVLAAALLAGADFQDLPVKPDPELYPDLQVPLLLWVALGFDSEDWQQLGHFFSSTPRWPSRDEKLGNLFLPEEMNYHCRISTDRVRNALRSGWDLKYIWDHICGQDNEPGLRGGWVHTAGLLDLAILSGNSDCADALATVGVELREDCFEDCLERLQRACCGESAVLNLFDTGQGLPLDCLGLGSASECQSAASAAAYASLRRSFSREGAEKGVAVCQVLTNKFRVPMALVHDILAFSMEIPKILDHLDLWDEVTGWMPSLQVKADGDDKTFQKDLQVEEKPTSDAVEEPGTLGLCYKVIEVFSLFFGEVYTKPSVTISHTYI